MIVKRYPYDKTIACDAKLLGIEPFEDVTLCLDVFKENGDTLCNVSLLEETFAICSVNIDVIRLLRHNPDAEKGVKHWDDDMGEELHLMYVDPYTVQFTMKWFDTHAEGYPPEKVNLLDPIVFTISTNELNNIVDHFEMVDNIKKVYAEINTPWNKFTRKGGYILEGVLNYPRVLLEKVVDKYLK